jgi:hypothetical protein
MSDYTGLRRPVGSLSYGKSWPDWNERAWPVTFAVVGLLARRRRPLAMYRREGDGRGSDTIAARE